MAGGCRAASAAAPVDSTTSPGTASQGVAASTEPTSTETAISAPRTSTTTRRRRRGANGTTAAGITLTPSATPNGTFSGRTTAAGTA